MTSGGVVSSILRLQVQWQRQGGDDVGVTTHDFRQVDAVWPDAGGAGNLHNFAQLEVDFATYWNAVKIYYLAGTRPAELRWYRNDVPVPDWGEPARITTLTGNPGTASAGSVQLPGQVACSITERVDSRRHWGRFYLPAPGHLALGSTSTNGRYSQAFVDAMADAARTLYQSWNTRGLRCVVLGSVKPDFNAAIMPPSSWIGDAFEKAIGKGQKENRILVAYDVGTIRVDDVPDTIRRRRPGLAAIRSDRTV